MTAVEVIILIMDTGARALAKVLIWKEMSNKEPVL